MIHFVSLYQEHMWSMTAPGNMTKWNVWLLKLWLKKCGTGKVFFFFIRNYNRICESSTCRIAYTRLGRVSFNQTDQWTDERNQLSGICASLYPTDLLILELFHVILSLKLHYFPHKGFFFAICFEKIGSSVHRCQVKGHTWYKYVTLKQKIGRFVSLSDERKHTLMVSLTDNSISVLFLAIINILCTMFVQFILIPGLTFKNISATVVAFKRLTFRANLKKKIHWPARLIYLFLSQKQFLKVHLPIIAVLKNSIRDAQTPQPVRTSINTMRSPCLTKLWYSKSWLMSASTARVILGLSYNLQLDRDRDFEITNYQHLQDFFMCHWG